MATEAREPVLHNERSHCDEKTARRSRGVAPLPTVREQRTRKKTQHSQNEIKKGTCKRVESKKINGVFKLWAAHTFQ